MKKAVALALVLTSLLTPTPASAHAQLALANPKVSSTLYKLPKIVTLTFDDDLIELQNSNLIQVTDPKGKRLDQGTTRLNGATISVTLVASTRLGKYKVLYRVISADGHPVTGNYSFYLAKK